MADFFNPPNHLKAKVGSGGLSVDILEKAQALLESNTIDFEPQAHNYLNALFSAIMHARKSSENDDQEEIIAAMLYPSMQLKANGGMFHYPLITAIADRLVHFLETVEVLDEDIFEITMAFHTSLNAVISGKITGDGGRQGKALIHALDNACERYFQKIEDHYRSGQKDDSAQF